MNDLSGGVDLPEFLEGNALDVSVQQRHVGTAAVNSWATPIVGSIIVMGHGVLFAILVQIEGKLVIRVHRRINVM